jgi:type I restriction enzyme S subunit
VDVIESVDNYITALETRAETARTARSALLHDLLSNPGPDWVETTFGKICSIDAQLVDPKKPEYRDLPHLAIEKIESRTGRIFPLASASDDGVISSKFLFTKDEVVYSKIRPELRKACRPGFAGLASADAYPLRPMNGCSAEFLLALVLSEGFSQIAVERSARTKMPKLNRIDLFSIPVQLPSLSDQFRIAELLVDFENLEIRIAATLNQSRGLRDALLSDLLSGNHEIPASYDQLLGAA